ncbi:MAG: glycosyltransferase family 2 protein [Bacteroidia bacterium]
MPPISVVMITLNAELHLQKCLAALTAFEEIIVLDNGSTDKTLEIARSFANVRIFQSEFLGFGQLKNKAASIAANDWIFSIDSDEIAEDGLVKEILQRNWQENEMGEILRWNYYREKPIHACGWANDWIPRIYHRKCTSFTNAKVHENLQTQAQTRLRLQGKLHHYSYQNVAGLIQKMQRYSTLYAEIHQGKKSTNLLLILLKTKLAFFKHYFLQKGIFYGYEGLLISLTNAMTTFYKYLKLRELSNQ